jgi:uncharacterized protein with PIN domain
LLAFLDEALEQLLKWLRVCGVNVQNVLENDKLKV